MRKTIIIYNPRAGKLNRKPHLLRRLELVLQNQGLNTIFAPTIGPGTAAGLARRGIAEGAELILAAGGDGTINEVAEGMVHSATPLGILPLGTANVLATEMGLGTGIEAAAARIAGCSPHRISVGRLEYAGGARHFLLMAGVGLDAHIVYNVSLPLKDRAGKLAYWVAGFSLLGRKLPEVAVNMDGRVSSCSFALVSKVRNYGGDLEIARDTSLFDDRFEVVLFEGRNPARYLKYLGGVVMNRLKGMKGVSVHRARKVCVSASGDRRVYVQVDGEYAGRLPATIEIVPDALTLLIPPGYARRAGRGSGG